MSERKATSRGNPSMGDILRTTFVLGLIVIVVFAIGQFLFARNPSRPTAEVDWRTAASGVKPALGFTPLVPGELPKGWYVNAARFENGTWHLGITDKDDYIGLEQGSLTPDKLVAKFAASSKPAGTVTIDGHDWAKRTGGGRTILVRTVGRSSALVTGTGSTTSIVRYVASLAPYTSASAK